MSKKKDKLAKKIEKNKELFSKLCKKKKKSMMKETKNFLDDISKNKKEIVEKQKEYFNKVLTEEERQVIIDYLAFPDMNRKELISLIKNGNTNLSLEIIDKKK